MGFCDKRRRKKIAKKKAARAAKRAAKVDTQKPETATLSDKIELTVEWLSEVKFNEDWPAEKSGRGWLIGRCDDPRLWGPYVRTSAKRDNVKRRRYEDLTFFMGPGEANGKTLVINGAEFGEIVVNQIPYSEAAYQVSADHAEGDTFKTVAACRVREVPAKLIDSISADCGFSPANRDY